MQFHEFDRKETALSKATYLIAAAAVFSVFLNVVSVKAATSSLPIMPYLSAEQQLSAPCDRDQENRRSDLCAQWKAADAASDSAFWAAAGVIAGVLTLLAAAAAAKFARDAAIETRRSVDTAQKALEESKALGRAQMRAYLNIKEFEFWVDPEHNCARVRIILENMGQTPAINVDCVFNVSAFNADFEPIWGNVPLSDVGAGRTIDSGGISNTNAEITIQRFGSEYRSLNPALVHLVIFADDVFGSEIWTTANYECKREQAESWLSAKAGVAFASATPDDHKEIWLTDHRELATKRNMKMSRS